MIVRRAPDHIDEQDRRRDHEQGQGSLQDDLHDLERTRCARACNSVMMLCLEMVDLELGQRTLFTQEGGGLRGYGAVVPRSVNRQARGGGSTGFASAPWRPLTSRNVRLLVRHAYPPASGGAYQTSLCPQWVESC